MSHTVKTLVGLLLMAVVPAAARAELNCSKLLSAPTIVVGIAKPLPDADPGAVVEVPNGGTFLFGAQITVTCVIRGVDSLKDIDVRFASSDVASLHQKSDPLRQDAIYVAFLAPGRKPNEFQPADNEQYAIKISCLPEMPENEHDYRNLLKGIARANIGVDDTRMARDWLNLLSVIYDEKEDLAYFQQLAQSSEVAYRLRLMAAETLWKHSPDAEGLYASSMKLIRESTSHGCPGDSVAEAMIAALDEKQIDQPMLREWLSTEIEPLENAALRIITERKDGALVNDVKDLLRSKQWQIMRVRGIQARCIEALEGITGQKDSGPQSLYGPMDERVRKWSE